MTETEFEGELGEGFHPVAEKGRELLGTRACIFQPLASKVVARERVGVKWHIRAELSTKTPFDERDTGEHSHIHLLAEREEFLHRGLVEDVIDDLYGIEDP
jgi:hypothetical protein